MLLNILLYTGELPTTKNYLSQSVRNAEVEKPSSLGAETRKYLSNCK